MTAIIFVFLPILYAVIEGLKYTPTWFSALIAMTLQTAYQLLLVAMSPYCLKAVISRWQPPSLLVLADQVIDP
jgi:TRAP-type mannitol/chloroaromatic compound transport system permease large subunit